MSDEQKIRELSFRVVNTTEEDREAAITALKSAMAHYLEEQSDELLLADLQKMNNIKSNAA